MRLQVLLTYCITPVILTVLHAGSVYSYAPYAGSPAFMVQSVSDAVTRISLFDPEIVRKDTTVGHRVELFYELPGEPNLLEDGVPAVPHTTRLYRIPDRGGVQLQVLESEFDLQHDIDMLITGTESSAISRDETSSEWFPASPVVMSEPMIFRDYRVVSVSLYPVQVNLTTREVRVYNSIECELADTGGLGANEITQHRCPSGAFARLYEEYLANLDERALDEVDPTPGSYLILCRNNASISSLVDSLAHFQRLRGLPVVVDSRASWTVGQMRAAIQAAYNTFDPPLEYVTIVGDPQNSQWGMPTDGNNLDHSFGDAVGNDDLEDVLVGRLSVSSQAELATVVTKLRLYEFTPDLADTLWTRRALVSASTSYEGPRNHNLVIWQRDQFRNFTGIDSVEVYTHAGSINPAIVRNRIAQGVGFFCWTGTWLGEMQSSLAASCTTSHKLPVVMTITEGTGNFADGLAISESWLVAGTPSAPKGGICGIGQAYSAGHPQYVNTLSGGFVYNVCNLGVEHVGAAVMGMKLEILRTFGLGTAYQNHVRWVNLMGDPALSMWTDRPRETIADYPATVSVGANCIPLDVRYEDTGEPVEDALVVMPTDSATYARAFTDAQGHVDLPVSLLTADTFLLAITKRNHVPVFGAIVGISAPISVTTSSYVLDDDNVGGTQGNSDHQINPSELIDIPVYLRNNGLSGTAQNISARLTCDNPNVTIISGNQTCPDLAPGDSALATPTFRIFIAARTRYEECVPLRIEIVTGSDTTCSLLQPTVHAGKLEFVSATVSGGDGDAILEPDEAVELRLTLRNVGDVRFESGNTRLYTRNAYVGVEDAIATFGPINPDQSAQNTADPFLISAHRLIYPGTNAHMQLIVSDGLREDIISFSISVGETNATDPTGPDAFGYFAYENTDTAYAQSRAYNWIDIRTNGANLAINDRGEEVSSDPVNSVVRDLPFDFIYYGQTFSQITICSNGWAAFGDHMGMDQHMNYSIPGQQAPDAMLAPFWDDLQTANAEGLGVWDFHDHDFARYIIQWNALIVNSAITEQFEIVLLDPAVFSAGDGSGIIIFQYADVHDMPGETGSDIPYCTVGMQAPGNLVGLLYRFMNASASGTSPFVPERSIVFTTEHRIVPGTVTGTVTNSLTHEPVSGAIINFSLRDSVSTNSAGEYVLQNLPSGFHNVRITALNYEPFEIAEFLVLADSLHTLEIELLPISAAAPSPPVVHEFALHQNYPNPLNGMTQIEFDLPQSSRATLHIYNLLGESVMTVLDDNFAAGAHRISVDASALSSGVYFYRLVSATHTATAKMVLLK